MTVSLDLAVAALREGRIVGVPTDTVYGIAADPFCEAAVQALFSAKGRPAVKPIPILAADHDQVMTIGILDEQARAMVAGHWPGAVTLVVPRVDGRWPSPAQTAVGMRRRATTVRRGHRWETWLPCTWRAAVAAGPLPPWWI